MSNAEKVISLERIGKQKDIIRISFRESINLNLSEKYINAALKKCLKFDYYKIIIDLKNISEISINIVGVLISATVQVRRRGGDIKIINLSENCKETVTGFNAFTFFSIKS